MPCPAMGGALGAWSLPQCPRIRTLVIYRYLYMYAYIYIYISGTLEGQEVTGELDTLNDAPRGDLI